MSISVEYARKHINEPAVISGRREAGKVLSNDDFEDPTILGLLVESNVLNLNRYITIGQAWGAILERDVEPLTVLTSNMVDKIQYEINKKESIEKTEPSVSNRDVNIFNDFECAVEEILLELNSYIGLQKVKVEISNLINLIKVRKKREELNLKNPIMTHHLCFLGNPGTGKTSIARIMGKLYKAVGILNSGHLIEVGRQDLVGEYIGQTAMKTKKILNAAKDGILFIDEAYTLSNKKNAFNNDFGLEAIEVILKEMEDNRDNFVLIVAGYEDLMLNFLDSNPGLKSRFNTFIHFQNYSPNELVEIMQKFCKDNDYKITEDTKIFLEKVFMDAINKEVNFSNARYVRNLFERSLKYQAQRISKINAIGKENYTEINIYDIVEANNVQ